MQNVNTTQINNASGKSILTYDVFSSSSNS